MKLFIVFPVFIFSIFLCFANADTVEFRSRKTETLAIFAFDKNVDPNLRSYYNYFVNLLSLWDVNKNIIDYSNLPMQIFFGKYNATSLLQAADAENNTAAMIVLINNNEFLANITKEIKYLDITSTTKCEQSIFCQFIQTFLKTPRDPLTKLNLVFVSNICPDSSFFKDFFNFGADTLSYKTTKTYLITNAKTLNNETCKSDNIYLDHQFIPNFNDSSYSFKFDTKMLADPRLEFDTKNAETSMFVTINETNYNKALKSIADYYNKNPSNYLITLTIQNFSGSTSKQIVTAIPKVDYTDSTFTVEEYLKQNFDYLLKQNDNKSFANFVATSPIKTMVVFIDDYQNLHNVKRAVFKNQIVKFVLI